MARNKNAALQFSIEPRNFDSIPGIYRAVGRTLCEPVSLDAKFIKSSDGDNFASLGDTIENENAPNPEEVLEKNLIEKTLQRTLKEHLTKRELFIIKSRFWEGKTLQATGNKLGLSRERVRQIEKEIKFKLKKVLTKKGINHA